MFYRFLFVTAFVLSGCSEENLISQRDRDYSQYHFKGEIDGIHVWFYESCSCMSHTNCSHENHLRITDGSGITIEYVDNNDSDLKVDYVWEFSVRNLGPQIPATPKDQLIFKDWLKKILEKKKEIELE